MQEMKLMDLDEKFALLRQARELKKQGKVEESKKVATAGSFGPLSGEIP